MEFGDDNKASFIPYCSFKNENFVIVVVIRGCRSSEHCFKFVLDDNELENYHIKIICESHLLDKEEEKDLRNAITETRKLQEKHCSEKDRVSMFHKENVKGKKFIFHP